MSGFEGGGRLDVLPRNIMFIFLSDPDNFLILDSYTQGVVTKEVIMMKKIATKWWGALAGTALTGALIALPSATFAHSLPAAASKHHQHVQAASGSDPASMPISVTGRIAVTNQAADITLLNGTVYGLQVGPKWYAATAFAGDNGHSMAITGRVTGKMIHVTAVNGQSVHGKGKPPWAGHGRG